MIKIYFSVYRQCTTEKSLSENLTTPVGASQRLNRGYESSLQNEISLQTMRGSEVEVTCRHFRIA